MIIAKEYAENLIIPPGILGSIDYNSCCDYFEKDEFLEEYIGNGRIDIKAEEKRIRTALFYTLNDCPVPLNLKVMQNLMNNFIKSNNIKVILES